MTTRKYRRLTKRLFSLATGLLFIGPGLPACALDETEMWDRDAQIEEPSGADWKRVIDSIPSAPAKQSGASNSVDTSAEDRPHLPPTPAVSPKRIAAGGILPAPAAVPAATSRPSPGAIHSAPAQGAAQDSQRNTASGTGTLLKGGVTYCVPSGTPFKLKLTTIPMPQMRQELRDEEGRLRPAQAGEVIRAKTTEDIYIDDNKVIPEGTEFIGKVSKILPPRRVGRPGHLELQFDSFRTPDGRTFAFRAEANNFKPSTTKSKLRGLGRIAAHGAGGAALGALISYQLFGLEQTIAMEGYNIAGGAALGCIGGVAWALWSRGPQAVLEPGDEFQMSIDSDLLVPGATAPVPKRPPTNLPGLEFEAVQTKTVKDGLGGHMLRVDGYMTNKTRKRLNSMHLFIEDEIGNRFPVTPDLLDDSETLFYVEPLSCTRIKCAFQVEFPKLKHKLIWFDNEKGTLLFEQKL